MSLSVGLESDTLTYTARIQNLCISGQIDCIHSKSDLFGCALKSIAFRCHTSKLYMSSSLHNGLDLRYFNAWYVFFLLLVSIHFVPFSVETLSCSLCVRLWIELRLNVYCFSYYSLFFHAMAHYICARSLCQWLYIPAAASPYECVYSCDCMSE